MKIFHLSDLHLGKRLCEYSLIEDQQYILDRVIDYIDSEHPDALIIAGDIYDKPIPPAEAVSMFDDFLSALSSRRIQTFIISGNHDSPERIAFGSRLMGMSGIHMSPVFDGNIEPIRLTDEDGEVCFYMLPFIKPANVRRIYPNEPCESYTGAVQTAVSHMVIDKNVRNVLITHQFVTGAERSESEDISVGGADNVDAAVFDVFDYTALGHIHGPQSIGKRVRYCGTPLKYSFSEVTHKKSITVINLGKKGALTVDTLALIPMRDLRQIRGSFDMLIHLSPSESGSPDDYMHITLTDEYDVPDALSRLRAVYPNLMKLDYDNSRTRAVGITILDKAPEKRSPLEMFCDFFEKQNGRKPEEDQYEYLSQLIEKIWGGENE